MAKKKEQKKFALSIDSWINKSNPLNEIRNCRMTFSQVRLFSFYLSKINPFKFEESREVVCKLEEYTRIMQFKQINTTRLIKTADDLLGLTIKYWDKDGKYSPDGNKGVIISQLFKRFRLYKNEIDGEWYVSINCHDDIRKLMFELHREYFKYQFWNILPLTSTNQQRMYELLKQYEKTGQRIITVKDLREWLWLKPEEYSLWQNFKVRVLDASQKALASYTDIRFTWEVTGKRGVGGKINTIKFKIEKNNDYVKQLTLDDVLEQEYIEHNEEPEEFERPNDEKNPYNQRLEFLSEAFDNGAGGEFTFVEVEMLNNKLREYLSPVKFSDQIYCYHYLNDRYKIMLHQDKKRKVSNRFGYLKSLIGKEI